MAAATIADLLLPVFSGRLVDAIASPGLSRSHALHTGERAVAAMAGLGALLIAARYFAFMGVTHLTVRLMSRIATDAFWRIQRFSTDWHANNFAGSIVRRITRGMWAVDLMNDTLLLALLPALVVLAGSSVVLGARWLSMGLLVAAAATLYVAISIRALNRLCGAQCPLIECAGYAHWRRPGRFHHLQRRREIFWRRSAGRRPARARSHEVEQSHFPGPGSSAPAAARCNSPFCSACAPS